MRWLRHLVRALNIVAALLVVVIGAAAWLFASESGTAWLIETIAARAAPGLAIGSIRGTLLDELRLERIEYVAAGTEVRFDTLVASVDLMPLVLGGLVIEDLRVSRVSYRSTGADAADSAGAPPSAPLAVIVDAAVIDGVTIETPGNELVLERLGFAARLIGSELSLERFETTLSGFDVAGSVTLTLAEAIGIDGSASWGAVVEDEQYLGRLRVSGRLPELSVDHELYAPFTVAATGVVLLEQRPRIDLELTWADVVLAGIDGFASPRGTAHVAGPVDDLAFETSGTVEIAASTLEFDGTGLLDGAVVTLERMAVTGREGDLTARGEIALDTLEWRLAVEGERLDPGVHVPGWPGQISASGDVRGVLRPVLEVATSNLRLGGTLRDQPFEARLSGALQGTGRARIDELVVTAGADRFTARGDVGASLDLAVTAEVGALEPYLAAVSGSASAEFGVTGTPDAPIVGGTVELVDGAYRNVSVARATLTGSLIAVGDGRIDLALEGETLAAGTLALDRVTGRVTGRVADATVTIGLVGEDWSGSLDAQGGLDGRRWRGAIDTLELTQELVGTWALTAPATLAVGRGELALGLGCLEQGGSTVCAEARLVGAPEDRIRVSAIDFDARTLDPLLPDVLDLEGVYQLDADFAGLGADPSGSLRFSSGPTRARLTLDDGESVTVALEGANLRAELEGWALAVSVDLTSVSGGRFNVALANADLRARDSGLLGTVEAFWPDLGALTLLSPDLGAVTGTLAVDVDIAGTRAEPEIIGEARWNAGGVEVPGWGVRVDAIEARASSADSRTLEFTGTGSLGGSEVSLSGSTELDPAREWPTRLTLRGESLPVVQRPDAEIHVTPDLRIDVALPEVAVTGTVHVPHATIALEDLPSQAIRPSSDTIVHGVSAVQAARPLHTRADLRITLGDDVHYSGSNLTTDVSGEMRLEYDSRGTTSAIGTLNVDGSYDAYGQSLDLDRGELLFAGPLDDPALDIRAIRRVGEQTVGVELAGTLRAPQTTIFSEPALSEADALAYLMFGRPLSGTGEQETATLESAAVAMGLQQALPVVQRIGESLGLDELSIQTTDVDAGALMAGKYLSPKLYIRYSYGLFNRIGGLLLRYKVNERLSIETRSGDEKSMDLLYTVEKE